MNVCCFPPLSGSGLFGQSKNTTFGTPTAFNTQTPFSVASTGGLGASTFGAGSGLKFSGAGTSTVSSSGLFGGQTPLGQSSGFRTTQSGGLFGSGNATAGGLFRAPQTSQSSGGLFGANKSASETILKFISSDSKKPSLCCTVYVYSVSDGTECVLLCTHP